MKGHYFCPKYGVSLLHVPDSIYNEVIGEWDSVIVASKILNYRTTATLHDNQLVIEFQKNIKSCYSVILKRSKLRTSEFSFEFKEIAIYTSFYMSLSGEKLFNVSLKNTDDFIKILRKFRVML